ncbi:MAG TPA: glycosyltransferase family protein [Candidatus Methanoperedens sp.]|nr:glycosyltransferase family protein [Candidatus Methanoperedens sp.]
MNSNKTKQDIKIVATIEARMTSTRLPGKVLKPILGKPMLELLIERLQSAKNINEIVVATTINDTDNPIIDLCNQLNVKYFRGNEEDVLKRVLDAAKSVSADLIVEITGDCPLIDPTIVDECIQLFLDGEYDYVSNSIEPSFPDGLDVKIFSVSVLEEVNNLTDDPVDHEHVSIYIYEHPERYCLKNLKANNEMFWPELGITLDTQEDYELINIIFEELYPVNPNFSALDIVNLIRGRPELLDINKDIKRKDPHAEKI